MGSELRFFTLASADPVAYLRRRLAEARQRLDLIACSADAMDPSQTAYAALACALHLDRLLYRGRGRRAERDRQPEIAAGRWMPQLMQQPLLRSARQPRHGPRPVRRDHGEFWLGPRRLT